MPMFFKIHGIVITIFTLLHSLSATTKLSVVSKTSVAASNATGRSLDTDHSQTPLTAITDLEDNMDNRRRSKYYSDSSREYNTPDYNYNWQHQQQASSNPWPNYWQQPQAYNPWPEYNYHDYHQVTSLPDLTTIVYPRLTTPQPLRHSYNALRPPVTKLYAKPYPPHYADFEDEPEEQLPFSPWYSGYGLYRWPSSIPAVQLTPVSYSGHNLGDDRISSIEHYHAAIGHHAPIIYHHHREESSHMSKLNMKHIGIAALLKLGLVKLKIFAILKLLFFILLKFKLLLLLMFIKFLLFLKAIKHLKALLIPLLLLLGLLLLPLLLLPLLLPMFAMRYLLPLLLLMPLPGTSRKRQLKADSRLMEYLKSQQSDPVMEIMVQLIEAETCVQRIACQLATRKESRLFYPIIKWYLNKITKILKHGRIVSYIEAYMESSETYDHQNRNSIDGRQWCQQKYTCVNSDSPTKNDDHRSISNTTSVIDSTKYVKTNRQPKK